MVLPEERDRIYDLPPRGKYTNKQKQTKQDHVYLYRRMCFGDAIDQRLDTRRGTFANECGLLHRQHRQHTQTKGQGRRTGEHCGRALGVKQIGIDLWSLYCYTCVLPHESGGYFARKRERVRMREGQLYCAQLDEQVEREREYPGRVPRRGWVMDLFPKAGAPRSTSNYVFISCYDIVKMCGNGKLAEVGRNRLQQQVEVAAVGVRSLGEGCDGGTAEEDVSFK